MKHIFIMNPKAGKGKGAAEMIGMIKQAALRTGVAYEIYLTKGPGDGEAYVRSRAESGEHIRFYACGGDGTLYDVVNGVYGHENTEVACIPMGSGNDFIRLFGTHDSMRDVVSQIEGTPIPLDVIDCNGRIAINQCSMGFDANVCDKQASFKKIPWLKGDSAYVASLLYCLITMKNNEFTIRLDEGEPQEMNVLFCFVGNSRWYGGGFMAGPLALPDDGLLDVVVVKKNVSKFKLLTLIGEYKAGKHLAWDRTFFRRARRIEITCKQDEVVNVDGEIMYTDRAVLQIVDHAVKFVVPANSNYFADVESGKINGSTPLY